MIIGKIGYLNGVSILKHAVRKLNLDGRIAVYTQKRFVFKDDLAVDFNFKDGPLFFCKVHTKPVVLAVSVVFARNRHVKARNHVGAV